MFGLKKEQETLSVVESLQQKSEKAISVFKDTLDSLTSIQFEADLYIEAKEKQISEIQEEIETVNIRKNLNDKFISKLKEFFE